MLPDATVIGAAIIGAATLIAALIVITRTVRGLAQGARRFGHLLDDWFGEPERPGVPARPGFPERLGRVETSTARTEQRIQAIEHELRPNSGLSLRDAVDRIETKTDQPPCSGPTLHQTFVNPGDLSGSLGIEEGH